MNKTASYPTDEKTHLPALKIEQDKLLIDKIDMLEHVMNCTEPKNGFEGGNEAWKLAMPQGDRDIIRKKIMELIQQL